MRIETDRLLLRVFEPRDLDPIAAMCADPEVMAFFPDRLDRAGTEAFIARLEARRAAGGVGMLAAEEKATGACVGIIGLQYVPYEMDFTPAVEVGWRLARAAWGKGYASEGAAACLTFGFETVGLAEIVAIAATGNTRSFAVMHRIGLSRDPSISFDHPAVPADFPWRRHELWRIRRD